MWHLRVYLIKVLNFSAWQNDSCKLLSDSKSDFYSCPASFNLNPFSTDVPFLYPLKTSENLLDAILDAMA